MNLNSLKYSRPPFAGPTLALKASWSRKNWKTSAQQLPLPHKKSHGLRVSELCKWLGGKAIVCSCLLGTRNFYKVIDISAGPAGCHYCYSSVELNNAGQTQGLEPVLPWSHCESPFRGENMGWEARENLHVPVLTVISRLFRFWSFHSTFFSEKAIKETY